MKDGEFASEAPQRVFSVKEVAERFRVSRWKVYRWIRKPNGLRARRNGRAIEIDEMEIAEFLQSRALIAENSSLHVAKVTGACGTTVPDEVSVRKSESGQGCGQRELC